MDEYGNLWGKLKSGAGWVLLKENKPIVVHETPYTVSLGAEEEIYKGPGFDFEFCGKVGKKGVYTIVEEAIGKDGFLWGKLKSGAGWVRLTDAPMEIAVETSKGLYMQSLSAWVPVYNRPSYDEGACISILGQDGAYAIATEVTDEYGNHWGELDDGSGWVDLDYVMQMGDPALTAYHAQVINEIPTERCDYVLEESEYMTKIAFRANERIENITFSTLRYETETYETEEKHCWLQWMDEGEYFVAGVVFYGDMTTYGISFENEKGETQYYVVYLSGMDGSVILTEYIP